MIAIVELEDIELIRAILAKTKNVNIASETGGYTALMWAIKCSKSIEIIQTLLSAGADVNLKNGKGQTVFEMTEDKEVLILLRKKQVEQENNPPIPLRFSNIEEKSMNENQSKQTRSDKPKQY